MTTNLNEKEKRLLDFISGSGPFAIAYSGGMDSSFLLKFSRFFGVSPLALSVISPFTCFDDAAKIKTTDDVMIIYADIIPSHVLANPDDRCYHCKKHIFGQILRAAAAEGCSFVCDGSNLDDADDYRPGKKALAELGVKSPLVECGFSKADICLSIERLNLKVETGQSNSCLAARIPYGTEIRIDRLRMIDSAEMFIRSLGFSSVRVRDHDGCARIEVAGPMRAKFSDIKIMDEVSAKLKEIGFTYVSLDLDGYRRGSLNESILKSDRA